MYEFGFLNNPTGSRCKQLYARIYDYKGYTSLINKLYRNYKVQEKISDSPKEFNNKTVTK
jgi:hypothetical protein